jgi:hypothetical protein
MTEKYSNAEQKRSNVLHLYYNPNGEGPQHETTNTLS